ncbi:CTD kinase subunit gamma CTK3-domain-containing protein [Sporodiniella umbellata]|nr:CTD kinase subunit gamma CTK3-domain-containing protein [Sporodiniella umbellata]
MAEESDPFECRLAFLGLLQKVNASQQSIHKVATFAMRHRKLSEDLYSCLVEELEQASTNARLNIIYVLDAIFSASQKAKFTGYIDLTRPDLPRIVHAVVANDAKGIVNVPNTQKIMNHWKRKNVFDLQILEEAEKPLLERQNNKQVFLLCSKPVNETFSKQDIIRRMEEDRERHKRIKEEIWIRPPEEPKNAEFEDFWRSIDKLNPEVDYEQMMTQNKQKLPTYAWSSILNQ